MGIQYAKTKSVSKQITTKGPKLDALIGGTMAEISNIVGVTLGPGGMQVLIERQEHGLGPIATKDGVTVFRSLGYDNSTAQVILEAARDAAVLTASKAGDGTTTATVLAEAITRHAGAYTRSHPQISPQKIVRRLDRAFIDTIEPEVRACSIAAEWGTDEGRNLLYSVAKTSANGDEALATSVLECFDLVGDEGNVTIAEMNGVVGYKVEKIVGFPIAMGYRDSCAKYYQKFINDPTNQRVLLEKPMFLLYHGSINEIQKLAFLMETVGNMWQVDGSRHNVVVVATGFSESVLAVLGINMAHSATINVFPLLVPNNSPIPGAQLEFLQDLAAVTGARILDPLNAPLESAAISDLGFGGPGEDGEDVDGIGLTSFEAYADRSTVIGYKNPDEIVLRADQIKANIENASSELDGILLSERLGRLTGGIAKLIVGGSSNGELKERRDRAEDAVCAVRAAVKDGCLPGGGWMLLKLMHVLTKLNDQIVNEVLVRALYEPVNRLLSNCGLNDVEIRAALEPVLRTIPDSSETNPLVYDALERRHVDPIDGGVLDSTPAVLEAVRNSLSIAALLGTMGGAVVFKRDADLERHEARENSAFVKDANNSNPADERA